MTFEIQDRPQTASVRLEAAKDTRLEALVRGQSPALLRFLVRRTLNREEAQDLAQEAFLRLTDAARRRPIGNPEGYLKLIIRNLLRDRAKSAAGRHERRLAAFDPETLAASDSDPHQALVARQTLARYEAAVMALKPKTREIFLMHRLDGRTYAEIAVVIGMSLGGVEKQMGRAIAHIDRALSRP
ncbi:RNA polymerase sigma factor [Caulobacter hibisci]|uniref:Sigma-70 family RNA polymerase sigma factor n=1 Tax=Caulobacter hibisci TaxID=2035993 RepID=A0ABS0SXS5_9CAUL|nr:sigma-70 family RNA polymerase sigma factor [Caulobacter hibisci]MBI1684224.1 sigma-70 family RNA polymerase sigma factor [Caulobacter hibisci]